jgi:endonuclease/exonuclease/phosphatase family metal-dependent hydrolase
MNKAGLALVAVAAGALLLACGGGDDGGDSEGGDGGVRIVVVDQNILHGIGDEDPEAEPLDRFPERLQILARSFASAQPDVLTLQEVVEDPGPDYPDVRGELLGALGDSYRAVFGNFLGDAIDVGGVGQMTLTRLPILSSENRNASGIRSVHRVTVQTDAGPVHIYNAHLEGTGAVLETDKDAAVAEMQAVIDFIEETRNGGPAILAGDLNAEPQDPSIQTLLDAGFIDALAAAGDAACAQAGDPGCTNSTIPLGDNAENRADQRIDYIFVLPGADVTVEVVEASLFNNEPQRTGDSLLLWPSDHIGVRAVLELR